MKWNENKFDGFCIVVGHAHVHHVYVSNTKIHYEILVTVCTGWKDFHTRLTRLQESRVAVQVQACPQETILPIMSQCPTSRSSVSSGEWEWQADWEWQSDLEWLHNWDWQQLWEHVLLFLGSQPLIFVDVHV